MRYKVPKIIAIEDIEVKLRGPYTTPSGKPRGLVIHYTAGRSRHSSSAKSTLRYLASKKLGCMVMGVGGGIVKASNQAMDEVAYHAGKSNWQELDGISRYCMGMEICCAGLLSTDLRTWWGEKLQSKYCRNIPEARENMKLGFYHQFTNLQEAALINFCLWQLDTNPEFDIDWVVGHDEIAPTRKSDPGGSLSVSMPEFRQMLRNLNAV